MDKTIKKNNESSSIETDSMNNISNNITPTIIPDNNDERLFTIDDIKCFILEAYALETKLYEGHIYSSSKYIGMADGAPICEYNGKYDIFEKVKELFKDYFTNEVIEKVLDRNRLVNLFGTIGIIGADGEPFYWINENSRINMLVNDENKKVVEIEELNKEDDNDSFFNKYTLEKQDSDNWLITDIGGCYYIDETKKQLYYYDEFTLTSSSYLENYPDSNVLDDNENTAWVEADKGNGIGEWLEFKSSINQKVTGIKIINGYTKSRDLYYENNRVKRISIELSDSTIIEKELNDNTFDYQNICFEQPVDVNCIRITILEVYPGNKYNDTCISEIRLYR